RDPGPTGRVATEELGVEIACALAASAEHRPGLYHSLGETASGAPAWRVFEATRHLARALRRGRGDVASRAAGFTALAREDALVALGPAAAAELMATAAWGRRRARDRAAALLAELPVTPAALDRLIDAELDALDQTHAAISVLREPGDELLARRLDERMRE